MKLKKKKCTFTVQTTTTSLYGVWVPKRKHTAGKPSPGFLLGERAARRASASPLRRPLARDSGVITSFGDGMKALYKRK